MYKGLFIDIVKISVQWLYATVDPGAAVGEYEGDTIVGDRCRWQK